MPSSACQLSLHCSSREFQLMWLKRRIPLFDHHIYVAYHLSNSRDQSIFQFLLWKFGHLLITEPNAHASNLHFIVRDRVLFCDMK